MATSGTGGFRQSPLRILRDWWRARNNADVLAATDDDDARLEAFRRQITQVRLIAHGIYNADRRLAVIEFKIVQRSSGEMSVPNVQRLSSFATSRACSGGV